MLQAVQRMVGDVQPEHLAFEGKSGALVPIVHLRHRLVATHCLGGFQPKATQQAVLTVLGVSFDLDDLIDRVLVDLHQPASWVAE